MPRRRKTKPETRLRKVRQELHSIKNMVRWAIEELRLERERAGLAKTGPVATVANELARMIGEKIVKVPCCYRDNDGDGNCDIHAAPGVLRVRRRAMTPTDLYDPAEDPNASPDAEHEMMVCSPVAYDRLLAHRERKAKAKTS